MSEQEPKYWLHRISWEWQVSYPLLKAGYLSIGWCDFGHEDILEKLQKDIQGTFIDIWGESAGRNRYYLMNFLFKMKKGDLVVVPKYGVFDIFKITEDKIYTIDTLDVSGLVDANKKKVVKEDDYLKVDGKIIDLGFFWKVELLKKGISRSKAEVGLKTKMRYLGTNLNISDVKEDVKSALQQTTTQDKIKLQNIQKKIDSEKLEDLVYWYFKKVGANYVECCSGNNNQWGNVDVIAMFDKLEVTIIVEVNYSTNVEIWATKRIMAFKETQIKNLEPSILWLIADVDKYSESIRALACSSTVKLLTKKMFANMLMTVDFENLDK